jgi:hypothetical protein
MHRNRFWAALLLLPLAAACPSPRLITEIDPGPSAEGKSDIPVTTNRNIDILFVIDNSDSMKDKQDTLAANFPAFIQILETIQGGLPDVHIGVVTSDVGIYPYSGFNCNGVGDDGILRNASDQHGPCPALGANHYIEDLANPVTGQRDTNYSGALADVFSCIARQGVTGCTFEQHLEGMKRALDGSHAENDGFVRPNAYLAVVIIGDEDDCSARDDTVFDTSITRSDNSSDLGVDTSYRCTEFGVVCDGAPLARVSQDYMSCAPRGDSYLWPTQHYVNFLRQLKSDPNLLIAAVIAGDPKPFGVQLQPDPDHPGGVRPELKHSCTTVINDNPQVADPAVRLAWFANQFGDQGTFVSICQTDLAGAMTDIARLMRRVIGTPCLEGPVDLTDQYPAMPGVQLDCTVSDVTFPGRPNSTETVLPRCPMLDATTPDTSHVPCWWTTPDLTACKDTDTHMALKIERGPDGPPIGTHEIARCVLD